MTLRGIGDWCRIFGGIVETWGLSLISMILRRIVLEVMSYVLLAGQGSSIGSQNILAVLVEIFLVVG